MKYFEEAKKIWQEHVPKLGQSDTVEGELLRAAEKLRDEAIRNGNGNWDEGFEILLSYLEDKLLDPIVFSDGAITDTRKILIRLRDFEDPCLEDEPYDELSDRTVEYLLHYGTQPRSKNAKLQR
ncbi:MAG: hypothetical protein HY243_16505 [Proteobacteria bacterium]|nr:hypothetical protein [Pseudomonadota bacterium]